MRKVPRRIAENITTGDTWVVTVENGSITGCSGRATPWWLQQIPLANWRITPINPPLPLDTAKDTYNLYDLPAWKALNGR